MRFSVCPLDDVISQLVMVIIAHFFFHAMKSSLTQLVQLCFGVSDCLLAIVYHVLVDLVVYPQRIESCTLNSMPSCYLFVPKNLRICYLEAGESMVIET